MVESRKVCLEEVKSKETDRPAAEGEASAVMEADALLGNVENGTAELVVEKDVLVEEFTRSETTREEKVIFSAFLRVYSFVSSLRQKLGTHTTRVHGPCNAAYSIAWTLKRDSLLFH